MTAKSFGELGRVRVSPEGFGKSGVDEFLEAAGVQRHVAVYVGTFMTALELVAATDYVCTACRRCSLRPSPSGAACGCSSLRCRFRLTRSS